MRLKHAIATILQSPLVGRAVSRLYGDVVPFHGLRIDVRDTGIPSTNKAALWWGMYESAEYRFVKAFLRPDLPVIELGSSIGAISSVIARQLARGQRLTCVEANPALIPALERNLRCHAPHLSVNVVHAAIAYDADSVRFGISSNNLTSSIPVGAAHAEVVVPSITLSQLIASGLGTPYQLVSDIEGAEIDILLRDTHALAQCRNMVIELHDIQRRGYAYTPERLISLLEAAKFHVIARYGAVVACQPSQVR